MEHTTTITELYLKNHNIGIEGLTALCRGIKLNKSLQVLDISGNFLGSKSKKILLDLINHNDTLLKLNIDNMNIGYSGV